MEYYMDLIKNTNDDLNYMIYDDLDYGADDPEIATTRSQGNSIQTHLSMPIVLDDVYFILSNDIFYCPRHIEMYKSRKMLNVQNDIYELTNNDPYPFLTSLFSGIKHGKSQSELRKELIDNLEVAADSLFVHKMNMAKDSPEVREPLTAEKMRLKEQLLSYTDILFDYFLDMKKAEKIKDDLCYKKIPFGAFIHYKDWLKVERDVFFVKTEQEWCIGPTNLLLCVLDIMQSRFAKVLYWITADITEKYPSSMLESGLKIINEMEFLRSKLGEDFYSVIANWESLVLGKVISDPESDLGFTQLYETALSDIETILKLHNVKYDIDALLPDNCDIDSIKKHIEMLGNTKHFGHPYIDVISGMENVKEFGTESVAIDLDIAKESAAIFTRDFIKEFILRKRRWPNCVVVPKELMKYYKMGIYPLSLRKNYELWSKVVFDKNFDYDYSPDTSELIKDSSASQVYSNWTEDYDRCAFKILHNQNKPPPNKDKKPTRVIQRYLQGDEEELKKKIEEVEKGYFDPDDDMAVFCRKEQELKKKGRLFVKQTYRQRLLQTSMENNISKQIMKYVPEQTMTNGEIQLMRRLANAAKDQKTKTEILNLDLSKWNMRFRHALVYWYGQILDRLFGFERLYRDNHIWFLRTRVFINSRLAPPPIGEDGKPVECEYFYTGHLGGMEGMRQKLWTIITICIIKLAAERLSIRINIMCQGDNQVVMIRYDTENQSERKAIRDDFLDVLANTLSSVNLILKREETWFSIRLCEFGKVRYIDGEAISNSDKKINRCIPDINDGISTFMSGLSTINTITEATAKYDYTPDRSFLINQFMILNYLKRKGVLNCSDGREIQMAYLYHPSDFGGISLSTYYSHFVRGYDDKVTLWLNILKTLRNEFPSTFLVTLRLNTFQPLAGNVRYEKLVEDIFALNIRNLPSIEHYIREKALNYLMSTEVTNPEVTNLFLQKDIMGKEKIVEDLVTLKPFIPSLAHEILRNSNTGILLSLRNRFTSITTITKVIQSQVDMETKEMIDFLEMTRINNDKIVTILRTKLTVKPDYFVNEYLNMSCMTQASEKLRNLHWNLNILGASKSYPICQFYIKPLDLCTKSEIDSSITINISSDYSTLNSVNYLRDGPYSSYLGSATRDKVLKPSLSIQSKTSYTKALQQLILIKSWAIKEGAINLLKLINILIEEKKNLVSEELLEMEEDEWCAVNYGGNIFHRFRSMMERNSAVVNFTTTVGTHFIQSTNNLAGITSGGKDFTIHFQLVLISNIARIVMLKEYIWTGYTQFCAVLTCGGCTKEVTGVKFDLERGPMTEGVDLNYPRECLPQLKRVFNFNELNILISIYLGKLFGSSIDTMFFALCKTDKVTSDTVNISSLTKVSINDLRYVDWGVLLIGMIKNSRTLRAIFYHLDFLECTFQRTKIFSPLCTFLVNAHLLESFVSYFNIEIKEHYQAINPDQISETFLPSFFKWFQKEKHWVYWTVLQSYFLEEDQYVLINNAKWVRGMLYRELERPERKILKQLEIQTTNYQYSVDIIAQYLEDSPKRFLFPTIFSEDELIIHLRYAMQQGGLKKLDSVLKVPKRNEKTLLPTHDYAHATQTSVITLYKVLTKSKGSIVKPLIVPEVQHLNRHIGVISTSASKIFEILMILNASLGEVKNIYCLAEGSGGIIETLGVIYEHSSLFYNTLIVPEVDKRMAIDQNYPPSLVASRFVSIGRLNRCNRLSLGITDITSPLFIQKLEEHYTLYRPDIITMDAESLGNTNNDTIIASHAILINKSGCKLAIYKTYFYRNDLTIKELINDVMTNYNMIYIKPTCSDPNSKEVYLCFILKDTKYDASTCTIIERLSIEMLINPSLQTKDDIDSYIKHSQFSYQRLKKYAKELSFPNDYIGEILEVCPHFCGLKCKVFSSSLFLLLGKLDSHDLTHEHMFIITREGGVRGNFFRIAMLILMSITLNSVSILESVIKLSTVSLTACARTGNLVKPYCVSDSAQDWKTFLRWITSKEKSKRTCRCKIPKEFKKELEGFNFTRHFNHLVTEITGNWFDCLHYFT